MIEIRNLKKRFRKAEVLRGVDLSVPAGKVTAFLGPNGAGKTTTIKCAMNLLDHRAGSIEVMGVAPRNLEPKHWQQIGYVSENQLMPEWMTVPKLLDHLRPMYGKCWDREFEKKLLADFGLPLKTNLKSLSRGQRMKAALLSSLAYRPRLVVLDEPFNGLDPLVRDEFLSGLLELTETEGWTVWVSSHDIEEVERFADRVVVLNDGLVDLEEDVEALQQRFRAIELVADVPWEIDTVWSEEMLGVKTAGRKLRMIDPNYDESRFFEMLGRRFPEGVRHEARTMTLREIFVALARSYRRKSN